MLEILTRAGSFIAIIVLGYVLKKIGVFREEDFGVLSKIVIRITLPAAIITSFAGKQKRACPVKPDKTRPQTSTYMTKGESEKFSSNSPFHPLFSPSKP